MATTTQSWTETNSSDSISTTSARRRWFDLSVVLLVAFFPFVIKSAYLLFHPALLKYTNARIIGALVWECISLSFFSRLFSRQKRSLRSLGFVFRWTDLPKALGLALGSFAVLWLATYIISFGWFLITLKNVQFRDTRFLFSGVSLWMLLPFLFLNPFFEEILVRGYLTTELSELRGSVFLATLASLALQTTYHLYYGLFGALVVGSGLSVFAVYYAKSRRLMPVILAHLLWDLTALLSAWHR